MTATKAAPRARTTAHATFTIERTFAYAPSLVFRAFADPAAKERWFKGPGDWSDEHTLDKLEAYLGTRR